MRSTFVALSLVGTVCAQSTPHTMTIPKVATATYGNSVSSFPLGRTGGMAQYWVRGDGLHTPAVVTAIGPRAGKNVSGAARTQSLEITVANTTLDYASFGKTFAQNLGATPTIAYARKLLSIPTVATQTDPDQPGVWIALDAPLVVTGPNLVLQFDLGTAVGATSASYNGDLITLASPGRSASSETSCGGILAATLSTTAYTLNLTGALPNAPTWLLVSSGANASGSILLPFKLDPIGMVGCVLGVDPQIVISGTADGAGATSLSVPITLPTAAWVVYAQAIHASTTTTLGLASTNVTRSVVGFTGFCSYIYNFTVDGPVAQNGPNNWTGAFLLQ